MIFCKSRKSIFLRVPKTASTSIAYQIQSHLEFQPGDFSTRCDKILPKGFEFVEHNSKQFEFEMFKCDEHAQLHVLPYLGIVDDEELASYKIYGVLRNPIDRFFSMFIHLMNIECPSDIQNMSKEEIAHKAFEYLEIAKRNDTPYRYLNPNKFGGFPMYPQANWLIYQNALINNIIIYPHFKNLLLDFTGNDQLNFNLKPRIQTPDSCISDSTIREIRKWYSIDFELWEHFSQPF